MAIFYSILQKNCSFIPQCLHCFFSNNPWRLHSFVFSSNLFNLEFMQLRFSLSFLSIISICSFNFTLFVFLLFLILFYFYISSFLQFFLYFCQLILLIFPRIFLLHILTSSVKCFRLLRSAILICTSLPWFSFLISLSSHDYSNDLIHTFIYPTLFTN